MRSQRALISGDYARSADDAVSAADANSQMSATYLGAAMRPALWGRDIERARAIAARVEADPTTGASTAAERVAARAGIAALEGRVDDAVAGYRDAVARSRSIGAEFEVARYSLDFVLLVGADHPATRTAAEEARVIFERIGARPYLTQLGAALAARVTDATEAKAGRTPVTSGDAG